MTPLQVLRHILGFEVQQALSSQGLAAAVLKLRRGALVVGWPAGTTFDPPAHRLEPDVLAAVQDLLQGKVPVLVEETARPAGSAPSAPVQPPVAGTSRPAASRAEAHTDLRVGMHHLEALLAHSGELVVLKNRLEQNIRVLQGVRTTVGSLPQDIEEQVAETMRLLQQDQHQLERIADGLTREVLSMRLRPAQLLITPLDRLVRDLAQQQGKKVHFVQVGMDTELDRTLLDPLRDALVHLLRNAIDHGVEPPEARELARKPATATLTLTFQGRGENIEISLRDDGTGIDLQRVRNKALQKGLIQEGAALSDPELLDLIFRAGFSTREDITSISGRGVGLDAVRELMEQLGGVVWAETLPGQGTTFKMLVPQTLATTRAFLVTTGGQTFALPSRHVQRVLKATAPVMVEGRPTVEWQGQAIPIYSLAGALGLTGGTSQFTVVLEQADKLIGIQVEGVLSEEEFVIKPLPWGVPDTQLFQGVVMDRRGVLIPVLLTQQLTQRAAPRVQVAPQVTARQQHLLVADDSLAVRTIQRSILEMAGYLVTTAENGRMAFDLLKKGSFDLLVSDIEMPELTGLELTRLVRMDSRLKHLPVILITSMSNPEHREEGMRVGADAYLIKGSYAPQVLLDTIGRLI